LTSVRASAGNLAAGTSMLNDRAMNGISTARGADVYTNRDFR
jgi:hypothetical protein